MYGSPSGESDRIPAQSTAPLGISQSGSASPGGRRDRAQAPRGERQCLRSELERARYAHAAVVDADRDLRGLEVDRPRRPTRRAREGAAIALGGGQRQVDAELPHQVRGGNPVRQNHRVGAPLAGRARCDPLAPVASQRGDRRALDHVDANALGGPLHSGDERLGAHAPLVLGDQPAHHPVAERRLERQHLGPADLADPRGGARRADVRRDAEQMLELAARERRVEQVVASETRTRCRARRVGRTKPALGQWRSAARPARVGRSSSGS